MGRPQYFGGVIPYGKPFDPRAHPPHRREEERAQHALQFHKCMANSAFHHAAHGKACRCLTWTIMVPVEKKRKGSQRDPSKLQRKSVCPSCRATVGPSLSERQRHNRIHLGPLRLSSVGFPCQRAGCHCWFPQLTHLRAHQLSAHGIGKPLRCGALFVSEHRSTLYACSAEAPTDSAMHKHRNHEHRLTATDAPHVGAKKYRRLESLVTVVWRRCEDLKADPALIRVTEAHLEVLYSMARNNTLPLKLPTDVLSSPPPASSPPPLLSTASSSSASSTPAPSTPNISYYNTSLSPAPQGTYSFQSLSMVTRSSLTRDTCLVSPYSFTPGGDRSLPRCSKCASPTRGYNSYQYMPPETPFPQLPPSLSPSEFTSNRLAFPPPPPADAHVTCLECQFKHDADRGWEGAWH